MSSDLAELMLSDVLDARPNAFVGFIGRSAVPIDFAILKKEGIQNTQVFALVDDKATQLRLHLDGDDAQQLILERHILGASSASIQEIILDEAKRLGFQDEKMHLFSNYQVSALRPDYFCRIGDTGVLLEVERGKTTINNMDLLDFWKCHICHHASYLFLVLPKIRIDSNGRITQEFSRVRNRLTPFFEPKNYVNVEAVYLFGY
jgi:hypothetical protein